MEQIDLQELKKYCVIPQKQEGRFLIRLKAIAGDLTSVQLRAIAGVAEGYATGGVHISTRQGIEIHHLIAGDLDVAIKELLDAGVLMGAGGPRARAIMACPGNSSCPNGIIETKQLASDLDQRYFAQGVPGKFKIAVCGCPNSCTKPVINDVGILGGVLPKWQREQCQDCGLCQKSCPAGAISRDESGTYLLDGERCLLCGICIRGCKHQGWQPVRQGYTLYLGGTLGKRPRLGDRVRTLIPDQEQLFTCVDRALEFYQTHGRKKERFGHLIDRVGLDELLKLINS